MKIIKTFLSFSLILSGFAINSYSQSVKILTDQVGYEINGPKHAVIEGYDGNQVSLFKVIDYNTRRVVYQGKVEKAGPVDQWKNWYFWSIDFDDVQKEGKYIIECSVDDTVVTSFPFLLQHNLLERNTLSNVIYYFKGQRCSGLLDKADHHLTFTGNDKDTVDVHGGWYDATGDYGKHLSHLSFSSYFNPQQIPLTVYGLFDAYDNLVQRTDSNYLQYERRLLDEAVYGADFLVRDKAPSGSFYISVSAPGPGKKAEDRRLSPTMTGFGLRKSITAEGNGMSFHDESNFDRESYEVSFRSGGGVAIAALAMAGTHGVAGDFSPETYLKTAEDAFSFLEENNLKIINDGKENIVDDYCALLAATELYKASKRAMYKTAADHRASNLVNRLAEDGNYRNYWRADDKDRPFFHAADAGLPVVALMHYLPIADNAMKSKVLDAVKKELQFEMKITGEVTNPFGYARQYVQNKEGIRRSAFFYPHDAETAPWWQGENARLASLATAARMAAEYFVEDTEFHKQLEDYAWNQLNWILGLNPYDACMLDGSGRNNIEYMFFNYYEYTNAPGGICNGITGGYKNDHDIDFNLGYRNTGQDIDWRWGEQWLPHATWFLMAITNK